MRAMGCVFRWATGVAALAVEQVVPALLTVLLAAAALAAVLAGETVPRSECRQIQVGQAD